jgi:tetratricopeptide (TPR) repeat protein
MEEQGAPVPHRPAPWGAERLQRRDRASALNEEGMEWFAEADYPKAANCFLNAIKEDRADAMAFNNLAIALHALGRPEEAWENLTHALHLDPNFASARENLRDVAGPADRESEAAAILSLFGRDLAAGAS